LAFAAEPILPASFAGWERSGSSKISTQAGDVDAPDRAVLAEYGLEQAELATYIREGHTLSLKAVRFKDASGAYGAYTFYRTEEMLPQTAGDDAVSDGGHVLFYRGSILVDANFDFPTGMSLAAMRDLAQKLPEAQHEQKILPTLPGYLPQQSLVHASEKFIAGPEAWKKLGLPGNLVDFNASAEAVLAHYRTSEGTASLLVISYPTPQIATNKLHEVQLQADVAASRKSGPLLAIVLGPISKSEALSLAESVNWDATVTWNERTFLSAKDNIGNLIVAAFTLIGVLLLIALAGGFLVGGSRMYLRKRGKIHPDEDEVIRLNL
jgi:uncharacterized protein DUF6599